MSRSAKWFWGIAASLFLVMCVVPPFLTQTVFYLTIGWAHFIKRALPQITIDWSGVATAAVAVVLLVPGLHWFLRWLSAAWSASRASANDAAVSQAIEHRPLVQSWPWRWTVAALGGVVLMFVAGIAMVGFVHQAVWMARSPAPIVGYRPGQAMYRSAAANQLKIVGLGLHNYIDSNDSLPPGGDMDRHGRMLHGWQTMLLPYIEGGRGLFERIDTAQPWRAKVNADVFRTTIAAYRLGYPHESEDYTADGYAVSDMASNVHVMGPARRLRLSEITDGTSETIVIGEATNNRKAWGDPTNWRDPGEGLNKSHTSFGGPWIGGTNFLMADGSVRFLRDDTDARVLRALATPAAGDEVPEF